MKVLMINSVCGVGSTGRICTDLADALVARGHEVKIAYGRKEVPEKYQKYAVRIGSRWGVLTHVLRARLADGMGYGSKKDTRKFIAWIKEYDPDVIHLHNLHGYYLNLQLLFEYLQTCGKKIIWTLHDCWAFTGHCVHFDYIQCEKWKNGCNHCPLKHSYPKSLADGSKKNWKNKYDWITNVPNMTIVTPSYWMADLTKESFLNKYSIQVIHNGIDTTRFVPTESDFREKHNIGERCMLLGVAGVWNESKGFFDYFKLAQQLDDRYRIVLVGLSKKQMGKLPSNIIGIEQTGSIEELARIYSAADVFVNLTYNDNYPTVNLEAISCGTPVITYNTGGSPESAEIFGCIVPKGDLDSVRFNIDHICAAKKTHNFSAEAMIEKYLSVLEKK